MLHRVMVAIALSLAGRGWGIEIEQQAKSSVVWWDLGSISPGFKSSLSHLAAA